MNLICLGCQSIPKTLSSNDITEGCGIEQASRPPRPLLGKEVQRNSPSKLVRGSSGKLKGNQSGIIVVPSNKERSFRRKDINKDACKPKLMRSGGMRRDWSLEDLRQIMNTL
ncbi:hypothetical protein CTI12_AA477200 [Artemisia annua]|uniref:Uncharacterized protein n=1 Tax=Artemisia annua TaxID=35608 RepID=A0A2U1LLQ4_ARTAN|nr:hypothetical protein CTI12_AA477200 [Artemisia annua]